MLSHFVGSPLTNCAEERNPLSPDGNAMKEAEREAEEERASKEKWYVTRMAATAAPAPVRPLCKSGKKRQCHSSGFVKFNWSRLTQSQSSKRHWPKGKEGGRRRGSGTSIIVKNKQPAAELERQGQGESSERGRGRLRT